MSDAASSPRPGLRWKPLAGLLSLSLCVLLPFLNKAVNIDDPLFIATARQVQLKWWDFYGFDLNWYGSTMRASAVIKNPPLTGYYLAIVTHWTGYSEVALHAAMLFPALLTVAGMYCLSSRLCDRPALATAVAALSILFVVSATTIMTDVPMVCLWTWATFCWTEGVRRKSQSWLAAGAMLTLLATLAKYFAGCLVPLLLMWTLLQDRRAWWAVIWLLLPVAGLLLFQAYSKHLYGEGLVGSAVTYAAAQRAQNKWQPRLLSGFSFLGGYLATALPIVFWATVSRWHRRWGHRLLSLLLGAGILGGVFWLDLPGVIETVHLQPVPLRIVLPLIGFSAAGLCLVWTSCLALADASDPDVLMLVAWVLGTFVFTVALNWTVSARNLLPLAPAMAILVVRRFDGRLLRQRDQVVVWSTVLACGAFSLIAARADEQFADSAREASNLIHISAMQRPGRIWFEGHWGFQYYMQQWGALPVDQSGTRCRRGEVVVVPTLNDNIVRVPSQGVQLLQRLVTRDQEGWAITDGRLAAGFYTDEFGPLPISYGVYQPDHYEVFGVVHSFRFVRKSALQAR